LEESIATKVVSTSYSDNVVENIIKTVKNRRSEQIGETELQNIREPDKDFDVYDIIYEGSYIVAGIVDKTSFAINT
jgi:cyclopropane fatty-acyl-phospholipid synthase-like methyltransferase